MQNKRIEKDAKKLGGLDRQGFWRASHAWRWALKITFRLFVLIRINFYGKIDHVYTTRIFFVYLQQPIKRMLVDRLICHRILMSMAK